MHSGEKTLLRFVTTGSVDDGKSTLIGRLLYETKSIFEDQFAAVQRTSLRRGQKEADLSLLLDGLSAEREQGITIDVAYRYFESSKRRFIIADSPGHEQYTRNTVTGASTADLGLILIDARNGVQTQSKRHGILLSLLQVPHLIVAVNKMDLVDYSERAFQEIVDAYRGFSEKLEIRNIVFIPVSALKGDNVTVRSLNMPWYEGAPLLGCLENIHTGADRNLIDFRFPVQRVIRAEPNFRGYAGKIASGTISPGEKVVALPSGKSTRIRAIVSYDGELEAAFAPQSATLVLEDDLDISRGDMIVREKNLPEAASGFEAVVCWMSEQPLDPSSSYLLKHTTRTVRAYVRETVYKIDVNTLHRQKSDGFGLNDIGRMRIQTSAPIFFDPYRINRGTGSFILIDENTSNTVAAGMIRGPMRTIDEAKKAGGARSQSTDIVWSGWNISRSRREARNGHRAAVLWFTGLSGSGKSMVARGLEKRLYDAGCQTMLLDGDTIRHGLCGDLGFSDQDRAENIRRAGETANLFFEAGHIVLCAFISPFEKDRAFVRSIIPQDQFFEIFVCCDIEECKRRDPNGLYKKALSGQIKEFTGISSPYEPPRAPEAILQTDDRTVEQCIDSIVEMLQAYGICGLEK